MVSLRASGQQSKVLAFERFLLSEIGLSHYTAALVMRYIWKNLKTAESTKKI